MIVVSDSSPLISLARIRQLQLLKQLYAEVIIPPAVHNEILSGQEMQDVELLSNADWLKVVPVDATLSSALRQTLDRGEAEAIVLALHVKADFVLIDERLGRKVAQNMGVRVVGLLGILVEAKRKGIVPRVKPLLDDLRATAFWVSDTLYQQVLRATGEE